MKKPIWQEDMSLAILNRRSENSIVSHLNIVFTEVGDDYLCGTMPVDHTTHQPTGILHGGASVVLAETLASVAGNCVVGEAARCVGLEINANHLASVASGLVTGVARPFHLGRSTQVWEIQISRDDQKLVCISRLTLAVLPTRT